MVLSTIGWIMAALALIGCLYQLFALWALDHHFRHEPHQSASDLAVTLLKPLHGAEPRLAENLSTFLAQDHRGPVQMVCGVSSVDDPAVKSVEKLRIACPKAVIDLVTDPARHGSNGKVSNLINMMRAARHDILVLSDSDMVVDRKYLSVLLTALEQPGSGNSAGAVTCLYRGRGDAGLWSRLSASVISHVSLPDMVVGYVTGIEKPCMGSTIALTRETLDRIGGFARFADVLADDNAIGAAVAELGLSVEVPPLLLVHSGAEQSFRDVWRQKLRWAVTIRDVFFLGYLGSVITRPFPLALLALPFAPQAGAALALAALVLRQMVARKVDRLAGERTLPLILLPVVDCLEFIVYVAAFGARSVDWRGSRLTLASQGRIAT